MKTTLEPRPAKAKPARRAPARGRMGRNAGLLGLALLALFALGTTYSLYASAHTIGAGAGHAVGTTVGTAIGSLDGSAAGRTAGHDAGLRAEDTTAEIAGTVQAVGSLEVLEARIQLSDAYSIGADYAAIYSKSGNAVFSVDLSAAEFRDGADGEMCILLPDIATEIYVDDSSMRLLDEYQKSAAAGNTRDAITAALNSSQTIVEKTREEIAGDEALRAQAQAAAKKQVGQLAKNLCGAQTKITVSFQSEGAQ